MRVLPQRQVVLDRLLHRCVQQQQLMVGVRDFLFFWRENITRHRDSICQ